MRVRYILTAEDLVVHGECINSLTLDWQDEATREQVMGYSQKWITSRHFLTSRMNGLSEVGESSLTIEPVEEGEIPEEESESHGFEMKSDIVPSGTFKADWVDTFVDMHSIPTISTPHSPFEALKSKPKKPAKPQPKPKTKRSSKGSHKSKSKKRRR